VERARPGDVVGVGALPCEEAEILLAAHSRADAEIAHEPILQLYSVGERVRLPSTHP
jgi:hypothetical protein